MFKKISILLLVSAVLVTGFISQQELNFWERTAVIFKVNSRRSSFEGRGRFNPREGIRGGIQRPDRIIVTDSIRMRYEGRRERTASQRRSMPDSLINQRRDQEASRQGRGSFDGSDRRVGRSGRRGRTIYLKNVFYYLAVFAFFTVLVIYIEKAYFLIFTKKGTKS